MDESTRKPDIIPIYREIVLHDRHSALLVEARRHFYFAMFFILLGMMLMYVTLACENRLIPPQASS
jgi:hypothetical protein